MPPSDHTTPLMPVARQLNWRQKCYKFFHRPFYFVYFLLLLVDALGQIFVAVIILCRLFHSKVINNLLHGPKFSLVYLVLGIVLNIVDALICWIFLGFVARSPGFVGCVTMVKYLIRLPKFWTLLYRLFLYILGVVLALKLFSSSASQNQEAIMEAVPITEIVTEALNVLTKVALVGVLNYVQVRNVACSRFKYRLLKGTLVVIWLFQMYTLIVTMLFVFVSFILPVPTGEQEGSYDPIDLIQLFSLPIVTRTSELIFTKILQDNKFIIGKNENNVSDESNESNSFTRQPNPCVSNAIETIT